MNSYDMDLKYSCFNKEPTIKNTFCRHSLQFIILDKRIIIYYQFSTPWFIHVTSLYLKYIDIMMHCQAINSRDVPTINTGQEIRKLECNTLGFQSKRETQRRPLKSWNQRLIRVVPGRPRQSTRLSTAPKWPTPALHPTGPPTMATNRYREQLRMAGGEQTEQGCIWDSYGIHYGMRCSQTQIKKNGAPASRAVGY